MEHDIDQSTHFFPFLTRVVQCLSMPMCDLLIRACKREGLLIFAAGKSAIDGIGSFAIAGVTVAQLRLRLVNV